MILELGLGCFHVGDVVDDEDDDEEDEGLDSDAVEGVFGGGGVNGVDEGVGLGYGEDEEEESA